MSIAIFSTNTSTNTSITGLGTGDTINQIEIVWLTGTITNLTTRANAETTNKLILTSVSNSSQIAAFQTTAGVSYNVGTLVEGTTYTPAVRVTENMNGGGTQAGIWVAGTSFVFSNNPTTTTTASPTTTTTHAPTTASPTTTTTHAPTTTTTTVISGPPPITGITNGAVYGPGTYTVTVNGSFYVSGTLRGGGGGGGGIATELTDWDAYQGGNGGLTSFNNVIARGGSCGDGGSQFSSPTPGSPGDSQTITSMLLTSGSYLLVVGDGGVGTSTYNPPDPDYNSGSSYPTGSSLHIGAGGGGGAVQQYGGDGSAQLSW